jgi:hypothetical protein
LIVHVVARFVPEVLRAVLILVVASQQRVAARDTGDDVRELVIAVKDLDRTGYARNITD